MILLFLKGILTGFALSLPFGPIGIYCMEKTIVEGEKEGYASAMGMVSVDFIYGIISFLFINILREDIKKYGPIVVGVIGFFLIYIGLKKILKDPKTPKIKERNGGVFQHYLTVFLVALVNIPTILSIILIYTMISKWLGFSPEMASLVREGLANKIFGALIFSSGIFLGGSFSWGVTIWLLHHYRKTINHEMILKITRGAGFILLSFGLYTVFASMKYILKLRCGI